MTTRPHGSAKRQFTYLPHEVALGGLAFLVGAFLWTSCKDRNIQLLYSVDTTSQDSEREPSSDIERDTASDNRPDTNPLESDSATNCELTGTSIRISEITVATQVVANEREVRLMPLSISPIPSGGSRLAWMGDDGMVHVTTLNEMDQIDGDDILIRANDFQDLLATEDGGVLLLTRDATGGGTLNCGNPDNLCKLPDSPVACFDMYLVRFQMTGEQWATKLTTLNDLPPYSSSAVGESVHMIWGIYPHHGRIASNGSSFAAYFGSAWSQSTDECIDIFVMDALKIVGPDGRILDGGFHGSGSAHGYERIVWNENAHAYVEVSQKSILTNGEWIGAIAFGQDDAVIQQVNPKYTNLSELVMASNGYWIASSMQPEEESIEGGREDGLANVHLYHFTSSGPDIDILIAAHQSLNSRAPHLAAYGDDRLLLAYETSPTPGDLLEGGQRTMYLQIHQKQTGAREGDPIQLDSIVGNRYNPLRSFPDGSVAYLSKGDTNSSLKILRVLPCSL